MSQYAAEIEIVSPESKVDDSASLSSMEYYDIDSDVSDYGESEDDAE